MKIEIRKSFTFIFLVLFISFLLGFSLIVFKNYFVLPSNFFSIFSIIYMYLPFFTVVIVEKFIYKGDLKGIGFYFKWDRNLLLTILMPIVLTFLSLFTSLIFKDVSINTQYFKFYYLLLIFLQGIIFGASINALIALGEEVGWRGYLLKNMIHIGFYKASFFIGLVWGFWHLPMILLGFNYPENPNLGVFMMILFCILLTPIMVFLTIKSKSVIIPSIFHGVLNAVGGSPKLLLIGGTDLTVGLTGLGGLFLLIIFNIIIYPFIKNFCKSIELRL